jgi:tetratricopeptide (TPR) repeat protein
MTVLSLLSLLFAQAASATTLEQDRLTVCQAEARRDPATAVLTASTWLAESANGGDRSDPQQCLGLAYVSLLRWQAAEQAFMAAHDARPDSDAGGRARLAAMAGNAALAENRFQPARERFDLAQREATSAHDTALTGEIASDRAQALVGLGLLDDAASALADARRDNPQSSVAWLLSATLSRRQDKLADAQAQIETAAALAPTDPAIGLEAGVIAALGGRDAAARQSFDSVLTLAPDSPLAASARAHLAQLGEAQPTR